MVRKDLANGWHSKVACGFGQTKNGKCLMPQVAYSFSPRELKMFCQYIKELKLTDGLVHAFKTNQICSATLMEDDMLKAQIKVVDILCELELIYPPALFDINGFTRLPFTYRGYLKAGLVAPVDGIHLNDHMMMTKKIRQRHVDNDQDPESRCEGCRAQAAMKSRHLKNSGICSPGPDGEMYYGQLQEIIEFKYLLFKVALFRVKWFDTSNKGRKVNKLVLRNNMTQINCSREAFKDDQYILDDDIIGDEDAIPYDLADFDVEDLINVDDDGVEKMSSADVARSHGGDGGGDDRLPSHVVPTGCGGCFANKGKGKRKPNLGGRGAGRLNTRDKTRNLSLKEIAVAKGPVPINFEQGDKQTLNPLGPHAANWSNYIGEVVRSVPLYYPSWEKVPKERKAAIILEIGSIFSSLEIKLCSNTIHNQYDGGLSTSKSAKFIWNGRSSSQEYHLLHQDINDIGGGLNTVLITSICKVHYLSHSN
ncbi:hypothetical protein Tco_0353549 [Tanacetum coccineum]